MRFSVLGPLTVDHDGLDITPRAPELRTVLALPLLSPESIVPFEAVVDELWVGNAPPSARNTAQSYVTSLRRLLAAEPGLCIVLRSYGYRLEVDPAAIDLSVFRQHVTAYRAQRGTDAQAAHCELAAALKLWHGQPLANVRRWPRLEASFAQLNELWITAVEQRIDLDIAAGRHHDVLEELFLLTKLFPLNENLCAQLMLALYRSGRRHAALEAYQTIRQSFADDLGLDPCPPLQRLHHAVLNCVPGLDLLSHPA